MGKHPKMGNGGAPVRGQHTVSPGGVLHGLNLDRVVPNLPWMYDNSERDGGNECGLMEQIVGPIG